MLPERSVLRIPPGFDEPVFLACALSALSDKAAREAFSRGLLALADGHGCELVGGDTTQGPLNICITVCGEAPAGQALLRSGARPGDDIYVSGTLGDARLALEALQGHITLPADVLEERLAVARKLAPEMRSSMLHDLERGSRLELPWLSGTVVRMGEGLGVSTPVHRRIRDALLPHAEGRKT